MGNCHPSPAPTIAPANPSSAPVTNAPTVTPICVCFPNRSTLDDAILELFTNGGYDTSSANFMTCGPMEGWCFHPSITSFKELFCPACGASSPPDFPASLANVDLSGWDTSNIVNMVSTFDSSSFNGDVSSWDVSSVTTMTFMFCDAPFNQDISSWDVKSQMFDDAVAFDQNCVPGWNILSLALSLMFHSCFEALIAPAL